MKHIRSTREIAAAAMFAALTLLATYALRIQTPTFGYIHLGDTFVLLSGIIMGPVLGSFAAGLGSALSDLLGGYAIWAPGTGIIKFLTALVAARIFLALHRTNNERARQLPLVPAVILSDIAGEIVMVVGYFFYNILILALTAGGFSRASLASAFTLSLAEIPFNIVQGTAGIVLGTSLAPVFMKIGRTMKLGSFHV